MIRRTTSAPLLALALIAAACTASHPGKGGAGESARRSAGATPWVSGYYVGYQRQLYPPEEVDFTAITHLLVGRIRPLADGQVTTDLDIDPVSGPELARVLGKRAHAAGRKALLMLGGDGEHAGFVAAASAGNRARFVANLLRVVDELRYDGLDIDWEPVEPADRPQLLGLVRELRRARPSLLLTVPVAYVSQRRPSVDPWYASLAAEVDQLNVMTYGMAGPWRLWLSWHSSALRGEGLLTPTSVAHVVERYLEAGIAPARLGIGIPFFGTCWQGVDGPRQLTRSASVAASDNTMSYANVVSRYFSPAARRYDERAGVPYLSYGAPGRRPEGSPELPACSFVSYEDEQSIAAKGAFVRQKGLGGVIVWTVNQGHLASSPPGLRDPLLLAVRDSLLR